METIRAAFVMGFGFGRANEGIADFVIARDSMRSFQHILAQDAVLGFLRDRRLDVAPMHVHRDAVYVNTLNAAGLGLFKLHGLIGAKGAPIELEVLAHDRQFARAQKATRLAMARLAAAPSTPPQTKAFLGRVTLVEPPLPKPMRMNRFTESWRQPWTCSGSLYRLIEVVAYRRDFRNDAKWSDPDAFFNEIQELDARLAVAP